jgi:mono/diheme cytochrome c family protein
MRCIETCIELHRGTLRLFAAALLLIGGCDDMTLQPKQQVYSPQVGPALQSPDTVEFEAKFEGAPPPLTLNLLQRGQERYRIYCTPCHSELGDGQGMVVARGFPAPPSFHIPRLRDASPQYLYDVITRGHGVMYAFANRVQPQDRWAIAAYIKALERSQHASLDQAALAAREKPP